jgi:hypothetical protein
MAGTSPSRRERSGAARQAVAGTSSVVTRRSPRRQRASSSRENLPRLNLHRVVPGTRYAGLRPRLPVGPAL